MNSREAVKKIIDILTRAISSNDRVRLIVSGGTSPQKILNLLDNTKFAWEKVEVMLADERLVKRDNEFSNERNLKENFFCNYSKNASYKCIRDLQFDQDIRTEIALLGFGYDGHFASIFPDHLKNKEYVNLNHKPRILKTGALGIPTVNRLTLNLAAFSQIENIFIIVNSHKKMSVIEDAKFNKKLPLHYLINSSCLNIELIKNF